MHDFDGLASIAEWYFAMICLRQEDLLVETNLVASPNRVYINKTVTLSA